jgi:hypothetical protein
MKWAGHTWGEQKRIQDFGKKSVRPSRTGLDGQKIEMWTGFIWIASV